MLSSRFPLFPSPPAAARWWCLPHRTSGRRRLALRSSNRALTISDAISTIIPHAKSPASAIITLVMSSPRSSGPSQPALLNLGQQRRTVSIDGRALCFRATARRLTPPGCRGARIALLGGSVSRPPRLPYRSSYPSPSPSPSPTEPAFIADDAALELSEHRQHPEHGPPARHGGVEPLLVQEQLLALRHRDRSGFGRAYSRDRSLPPAGRARGRTPNC